MGVVDYRVQPGATLTAIAAKLDVSLPAVEPANPQVIDPDQIFPDGLLHVPALPTLLLTTQRRFPLTSWHMPSSPVTP